MLSHNGLICIFLMPSNFQKLFTSLLAICIPLWSVRSNLLPIFFLLPIFNWCVSLLLSCQFLNMLLIKVLCQNYIQWLFSPICGLMFTLNTVLLQIELYLSPFMVSKTFFSFCMKLSEKYLPTPSLWRFFLCFLLEVL